MSKTTILTTFNKQLTQFIDELIEQFPKEPELILLRVAIGGGQLSTEDIIKEFSMRILPHQERIKIRDEKFFLEDMKLFEGADKSNVIKFKKLWTSAKLDKEDKDVIWAWFDLFVKLTLQYNKVVKE
jgi:hypothetical protein